MNDIVINAAEIGFRWPGQAGETLQIESLQVRRGEHIFLHGRSGSGKTTLLNLLAGITQPDRGRLEVLGSRLDKLSAGRRDRFRADHLGVIFQQFNLLAYLSVLDNVQLPCRFSGRRLANACSLANTLENASKTLLKELDIPEKLHASQVSRLSTGQQQRVAVARALIGQPGLLIADEPTSALDADNRDAFLQLLFAEADKSGATIVFVSHDKQIAAHFDRVQELSDFNLAHEASE